MSNPEPGLIVLVMKIENGWSKLKIVDEIMFKALKTCFGRSGKKIAPIVNKVLQEPICMDSFVDFPALGHLAVRDTRQTHVALGVTMV